MEIRAATPRDTDRIRRIAEQSFQTSYSLSPDQIKAIVESVFSTERLGERIENEARRLLVATEDDKAVGFADVEFGEHAILRWLHVEPGHRGEGIGTALFERARAAAEDSDRPLVGRVLTEDDEGDMFCEQFGYERGEKTKLAFEAETFYAYLVTRPGEIGDETDDRSAEIPETVTVDGRTMSVDEDDERPGTDGPFFRLIEEGGESYGYYCTNCGSVDVGSDSLGRLECQNCGNKHLADNWDAAYF